MTILLDVAPAGGTLVAGGLAVGISFLLLTAALIFFILARKTVKLAVRAAIVGIVLFLVIGGGIALIAYSYFATPTPRRPEPRRSR